MKLTLIGHDYRYAAEQTLLVLFPSEKLEKGGERRDGNLAESRLYRGRVFFTARCRLEYNGQVFAGMARVRADRLGDKLTKDRLLQRIVKMSIYRAGVRATGLKPVWGALTGIRPAKLMSGFLERGLSDRRAISRFCREFQLSPQKAALCLEAAKAGLEAKRHLEPGDICLYVGIPFCPTRCAYCSFVSQAVEKGLSLIPPFLDGLDAEIKATGEMVRRLGLRVIALYIGGGTPTTLSARQLDGLFERLGKSFDLTKLKEYTVEAGRPETIDREKLEVMRRHGVGRVSINPQSMDDRVLRAIGRKHTVEEFMEAARLAGQYKELMVNMDVIAGLPGDSDVGFIKTLDEVLALEPENLTVHTLSLKKGSRILLDQLDIPSGGEVARMLEAAETRLRQAGYRPYYLYRQKNISGGFENVGWSRKGCECLYNICMMEELCSVISMGGGASTKLVSPRGRIERVFNPKYPREYIMAMEKIVSDKEKIREFYHVI